MMRYEFNVAIEALVGQTPAEPDLWNGALMVYGPSGVGIKTPTRVDAKAEACGSPAYDQLSSESWKQEELRRLLEPWRLLRSPVG